MYFKNMQKGGQREETVVNVAKKSKEAYYGV